MGGVTREVTVRRGSLHKTQLAPGREANARSERGVQLRAFAGGDGSAGQEPGLLQHVTRVRVRLRRDLPRQQPGQFSRSRCRARGGFQHLSI